MCPSMDSTHLSFRLNTVDCAVFSHGPENKFCCKVIFCNGQRLFCMAKYSSRDPGATQVIVAFHERAQQRGLVTMQVFLAWIDISVLLSLRQRYSHPWVDFFFSKSNLMDLCVKYFAHSTPVRGLMVKSSNLLFHFGSPRSQRSFSFWFPMLPYICKENQEMKWSALFSSPEPLTHHGCRLCTSSKTNCSWTTGVGANANHAAYSSSSSSTSKKQEKKPRRKQNASYTVSSTQATRKATQQRRKKWVKATAGWEQQIK